MVRREARGRHLHLNVFESTRRKRLSHWASHRSHRRKRQICRVTNASFRPKHLKKRRAIWLFISYTDTALMSLSLLRSERPVALRVFSKPPLYFEHVRVQSCRKLTVLFIFADQSTILQWRHTYALRPRQESVKTLPLACLSTVQCPV